MKHANDDSKTKHAKSNKKHQKAVALRAQWLEDNPEKKKSDWNFAQHLICGSMWKRSTQKKNALLKPSFHRQKKEFCKRSK